MTTDDSLSDIIDGISATDDEHLSPVILRAFHVDGVGILQSMRPERPA